VLGCHLDQFGSCVYYQVSQEPNHRNARKQVFSMKFSFNHGVLVFAAAAFHPKTAVQCVTHSMIMNLMNNCRLDDLLAQLTQQQSSSSSSSSCVLVPCSRSRFSTVAHSQTTTRRRTLEKTACTTRCHEFRTHILVAASTTCFERIRR
jgi:hypothetical protein